MLQLADGGKWDDVVNATAALVQALDELQEVRMAGTESHLSNTIVEKTAQVRDLLDKAISKCAERQQQIAPLLDALSNAANPSRQT